MLQGYIGCYNPLRICGAGVNRIYLNTITLNISDWLKSQGMILQISWYIPGDIIVLWLLRYSIDNKKINISELHVIRCRVTSAHMCCRSIKRRRKLWEPASKWPSACQPAWMIMVMVFLLSTSTPLMMAPWWQYEKMGLFVSGLLNLNPRRPNTCLYVPSCVNVPVYLSLPLFVLGQYQPLTKDTKQNQIYFKMSENTTKKKKSYFSETKLSFIQKRWSLVFSTAVWFFFCSCVIPLFLFCKM